MLDGFLGGEGAGGEGAGEGERGEGRGGAGRGGRGGREGKGGEWEAGGRGRRCGGEDAGARQKKGEGEGTRKTFSTSIPPRPAGFSNEYTSRRHISPVKKRKIPRNRLCKKAAREKTSGRKEFQDIDFE